MERHPMPLVERADESANLRSQDLQHRDGFRGDDVYGHVPRAKRRGHLEPDEARADHNSPLRDQRFGDQRTTVGEGTQIVDVRETRARHIEMHGLGARGEQQRIVRLSGPVRELDASTRGVDRGYSRVQFQFDTVFAIEACRSERVGVVRRCARQVALGEIGAIAGPRRIGAEHRDAARVAQTPEHFCGGVARGAAAHNHDRLRDAGLRLER
jgi:hypothetical protein